MTNEEQPYGDSERGVDMDPGITFPARPPLEVRPDGSIVENEPGSADDIEGQVERLGAVDRGQRYALTLKEITLLFRAFSYNWPDQIQATLERTLVRDDLGDLVNEEIARQEKEGR